jgi:hypothetical protein
MENTTKPTQDCGCEGDCCPPKPKPRWIKYLSFLILIAALSIVVIKITQDKKSPATQCKPTAGQSCCGDSSKTMACDTTKGTSCCPKSEK